MTREEFLEKLDDNQFAENMMPIFDFFESRYENNITDSTSIDTLINELNNNDVKNKIYSLKTNLFQNERKFLGSYCASLYQNIIQFVKKSNTWDLDKMKQKWKKVSLSYINLSRLIIDDDKIQSALSEQDASIRIVFSVSTINIEDDDVKVNEEIINIQEINNQNPNEAFLVIPIHGCNFDMFKKQINEYNNITHIHIAGHSSASKLEFSDNGVTYSKLNKLFENLNRHFDLLFLNCCFTYEYLGKNPFPYSDKSICHENELNSTTAYNASAIFYNQLFQGRSIDEAWIMVQNSIEDTMYHVLHP